MSSSSWIRIRLKIPPRSIAMDLAQFMKEDNGNFSSSRLGFLLWVIGVLAVWVIDSLKCPSCTLATIPESVITIVGILMGGKVVQKFGENKGSTPLPSADTGAKQ
jgi:hypothetical protein